MIQSTVNIYVNVLSFNFHSTVETRTVNSTRKSKCLFKCTYFTCYRLVRMPLDHRLLKEKQKMQIIFFDMVDLFCINNYFTAWTNNRACVDYFGDILPTRGLILRKGVEKNWRKAYDLTTPAHLLSEAALLLIKSESIEFVWRQSKMIVWKIGENKAWQRWKRNSFILYLFAYNGW